MIAKGTTFPERDLYKHNSTSPDGMTYKTEHIFLMKGDIQAWLMSNLRAGFAAILTTTKVVAKLRERVSIKKQKGSATEDGKLNARKWRDVQL